MPRLASLASRLARKLRLALGGLPFVIAAACSGPNNPGEMPPMGPKPEPVEPMPGTDPDRGGSPAPVPGAPDPLDPSRTGGSDGGVPVTSVTALPGYTTAAYAEPMQNKPNPPKTPSDAGVPGTGDAAAPLPPTVPDALPVDAARRAE